MRAADGRTSDRRGAGPVLAVLLMLLGCAGATPDRGPPYALPLPALAPAPEGTDARALAERAAGWRPTIPLRTSARMVVSSPNRRQPRVVVFELWADPPNDRARVRVVEPPRERGTGFLRIGDDRVVYTPRVDRVLELQPAVRLQPWLGSELTHDDLSPGVEPVEDYTHTLHGVDEVDGRGAYVVEYRRAEGVEVAWDRIFAWIDAEWGVPLRRDYLDAEGRLLREVRLDQVRDFEGFAVPRRWTVTRSGDTGHSTVVEVGAMFRDPPVGDDFFTRDQLRAAGRGFPDADPGF